FESVFCSARSVSASARRDRQRRSSSRISSTGADSPFSSAARLTSSGFFRMNSSASTSVGGLFPQRREEDHVANRSLVGHEHHKPVNADADTAGRRQPVLQCTDVVLVERVRL